MVTPRIRPADPATIAEGARLLAAGRLVAFPTETVYGLGADARSVTAVRSIFRIKGRPADHPLIVHLAAIESLHDWCRDVPSEALDLARVFWPGPLTLILPRAAGVPDVVTGGQDFVGVRVPRHPVALALLRAFGGGVAAPSANRFGRISPTTAAHVAEDLGDDVELIVDGGPCPVGIESTIVSFADESPTLLRPGGISVEALAQVLGRAPEAAGRNAPRASGTLASHYAPRASARLVDPRHLAEEALRTRSAAVLARTVVKPEAFGGHWLAAPHAAREYAQALYAGLRTLDRGGVEVILIEAPPESPEWLAVHDRLRRATHAGDAPETGLDDAD